MNSEIGEERIALVTGATRGIGRAVTLGFAAQGIKVIAVARKAAALEALDDDIRKVGLAATLVPLDLRDGPAIDRLGGALFERWGRLDILVGNAGVLGPMSPLPHVGPKDWDEVVAVNLTANFRLIRAMDPLLRAADAGRAIFVTSGAAQSNKPFWGPYAASKAGLDSLVKTYAAECDDTTVKANLLNPGPIRTDMRAQAMPGEDPETLPPPDDLVPWFLHLAKQDLRENGRTFNFERGSQPSPA